MDAHHINRLEQACRPLEHLANLGRLYPKAWRQIEKFRAFDPDVRNAAMLARVSGEMNYELLYRLPEWCVYIETPDQKWGVMPPYKCRFFHPPSAAQIASVGPLISGKLGHPSGRPGLRGRS